ncbi:MAG: hypothetical protein AVW05_00540 [Hadesarchaea archaeon DG-33]|nr:MAG: hypothetical protein AVW05_00540 [Hadesarchaea archaeon DG-33]
MKKRRKKMFGTEQRGVAAITAIVIVAASIGAGVATPVIVDAVDVDPDSPFYGLERLGEQIRMVGGEDQMKERWGEYVSLVNRGKGLAHKSILEEFVEKMRYVVPGDVETKREIVQWMQEQMPEIGMVQLRLCKELCQQLRQELENTPEAEWFENCIRECENFEENWDKLELRAQIRARLRLIREITENIANRYRAQIHKPMDVDVYFDIDNVLVDVDITVNVEVDISAENLPDLSEAFENKLEEFDNLLAEVQIMLEGAPENAHGKHAAERLVEVAIGLKDKAVAAYEEGKIRRALALIHAAKIHLGNAERILENAEEWEPEFATQWYTWRNRWENMKQEWTGEGIWENIIENYNRYAETVRKRWEEEKHKGPAW